jgi:hypothetical protein
VDLFKNIFSHSLNTECRYQFVRATQLNQSPFLFCETVLGNLVRVLELKDEGFNLLLEPQRAEEIASWVKTQNLPVICLNHTEIPPQSYHPSPSSLWRVLLPFPWNAIDPEGTSKGKTLEFSDPLFEKDWRNLKNAFDSLEAELKKSEISAILVKDAPCPMTFVFHYVRGRLMNAGIQAEVLSAEALQKSLGTSVTFLEMNKPKELNLLGLNASCEILQKTCESSRTLFPVALSSDPPIHFEL